jgi:hypothetical protein
MSIGYFASIAEAETYFEDERLETRAWDALTEDSTAFQKSKVIRMAYNRIFYDPRWELPTYAEISASASDLSELQKANAEMAYYLAIHLSDEDIRKGLQAQGVIEAGVVKEKYSEAALMDVPVPPFVIAILSPWSTEVYAGVLDLARDEEESVRTKVHKF